MATTTTNNEQKHYNKDSWPDIFKKSKVVLRGNAFDEISTILIECADANFTEMFGHSLDIQLRLNDLIGPATSLAKFDELKRAMDNGKSTCAYVNLYKSDGTALSCHVSFLSITGQNTFAEENSFSHNKLKANARTGERYGVLTIRSAAVVGNARDFGIGFFGLSTISEDAKLCHVARLFGVTQMQQAATVADPNAVFTHMTAEERTTHANPYQTRTLGAFQPLKKYGNNEAYTTPMPRKIKSRKMKTDSGSDDSACGDQRVWKKRSTASHRRTNRANSTSTVTSVATTSGATSTEGCSSGQGMSSYDSYEEELRHDGDGNVEMCQGNFVPLLDHDQDYSAGARESTITVGSSHHHNHHHHSGMGSCDCASPLPMSTFPNHSSASATSDEFADIETPNPCFNYGGGSICTVTTIASSAHDDMAKRSPRLIKPTFSRKMPGPLIDADVFQTGLSTDYSASGHVKRKSPVRPLSPSLMALACGEDFVPNRSGNGYSIL